MGAAGRGEIGKGFEPIPVQSVEKSPFSPSKSIV